MNERYDAVISLGSICAVAAQLKRRGLRDQSYGLDWCGGYLDPSGVEYLCEGLLNEFKEMALEDNLRWMTSRETAFGLSAYYDEKSHHYFPHTFHVLKAGTGWYREDGEKLHCRLRRITEKIRSSKRVLLVLATRFEFELDLAKRLYRSASLISPDTFIKLVVVQFNSRTMPFGVNVGEGAIDIYRYARPDDNDYDLRGSSIEWKFLDRIEPLVKPERTGLRKLMYRIWKRLSKSLWRCGYRLNLEFLYLREIADINGSDEFST